MSAQNHEPAVRAIRLRKVYSGGHGPVEALRLVDLDVPRGQFLCVMGPSGSGKSTLLHLLAGLETPTEGSVHVAGTRIDALSTDDSAVFRRRNIGVVYQFFNLIPSLTVEENVAVPLLLDGKRLSQVEEQVEELLEFLEIGGFGQRRADALSGGEMQRVAIARALLAKPALILADEPTGNLDSRAGALVLSALRRTVEERNVTLVLVTHDPAATSYADRVVEMSDGEIIQDLPADRAERIV